MHACMYVCMYVCIISPLNTRVRVHIFKQKVFLKSMHKKTKKKNIKNVEVY